jgi:hypothetical protein
MNLEFIIRHHRWFGAIPYITTIWLTIWLQFDMVQAIAVSVLVGFTDILTYTIAFTRGITAWRRN